MTKLLLLFNAASENEQNGLKTFTLYKQDMEIIKAMKKLDVDVETKFVEEGTIVDKIDSYDVVFNLADAYAKPEDEYALISELEKSRIPFTGCGSKASMICQDKYKIKKILNEKGVRTPVGVVLRSLESVNETKLPNFPLILKPLGEDASVGIDEDSVVFKIDELTAKLGKLLNDFKLGILAEEYIEGREFNIPIIGNEHPLALPMREIDYSEHFEGKPKILTYDAKWNKDTADYKNTYSRSAKINDELKSRINDTAIAAYNAAGLSGYGSVDIRMDKDGNCFVLEVNPNCYIAPEADIVKAAKNIGMTYEELLSKVIDYSVQRFER